MRRDLILFFLVLSLDFLPTPNSSPLLTAAASPMIGNRAMSGPVVAHHAGYSFVQGGPVTNRPWGYSASQLEYSESGEDGGLFGWKHWFVPLDGGSDGAFSFEGEEKRERARRRRRLATLAAAVVVAGVSHLWGMSKIARATPLAGMFGGGGGDGGYAGGLMDPSKNGRQGLAVSEDRLRSILKVFCTHMEPSFTSPWQMRRPYQSTSSAFVIGNRRIVTNAHGVAYHKMVQVRKHGDSLKYIARVLHIVHDSDLALLTVEDPQFWTDVVPFELDTVPNLQEKVTVIGYPQGGDKLSITEGIISRVDMARYAHSDVALLVIQIDAAINAGNSGGPALINNKVVGVAFQAMVNAENIGYLVPTLLIHRLLLDVARNNHHTGFVSLGIFWQAIENPVLQQKLGVSPEGERRVKGIGGGLGENTGSYTSGGVLIRKVETLYNSSGVLKAGDVLYKFEDRHIATDGTVVFRGSERVSFAYLLLRKFVGERAKVSVLRNGTQIEDVEFYLESRKALIPRYLIPENKRPSYFIHSGLVFSVLTHPYLGSSFGNHWEDNPHTPLDILNVALTGVPENDGDQVVVLSHVLTSEITTSLSYHHLILKYLDDVPIKNIQQLYKTVQRVMELQDTEAETTYLEFKVTSQRTPSNT